MSKRILTVRQKQFVEANYLLLSSGKIADHMGCSKFFIQRYLKRNGLVPPPEVIESFRIEGLKGRTTSTAAIDKKLRAHYLTVPEKRLAAMVNKSSCFVRGRLRQLGLIIPLEIREQRKADSRIKPGDAPANKGRKQSEWMSKEAIARTAKTRFKKGTLPHNTKSDFDISVRPDNRGVKVLFIRVQLGKWEPLQRYIWERDRGPIPKGMKIVFKDGNTYNCNIENLEILSPKELMLRNTIHRYGPEIFKTVQLRGALNRQINKHLKKLRNEK